MKYTLKVTETGKKSGKYHYQVVDETGKIISERSSNREYVACTINGSYYFGRLDLIGKGDHGRYIKFWSIPDIASTTTYTEEEAKKRLKSLTTIAYLEDKSEAEKLAEKQAVRIAKLK